MVPREVEALTRFLLQRILLVAERAHIHAGFGGREFGGRAMLVRRAQR